MTSVPIASCDVEGAAYLTPSVGADELCRMFGERVEAAMRTAGADVADGGWSAEITLTKNGSAEARIARTGEGSTAFPVIAVDVMDRPLRPEDVLKLADAVAEMLLQQQ